MVTVSMCGFIIILRVFDWCLCCRMIFQSVLRMILTIFHSFSNWFSNRFPYTITPCTGCIRWKSIDDGGNKEFIPLTTWWNCLSRRDSHLHLGVYRCRIFLHYHPDPPKTIFGRSRTCGSSFHLLESVKCPRGTLRANAANIQCSQYNPSSVSNQGQTVW